MCVNCLLQSLQNKSACFYFSYTKKKKIHKHFLSTYYVPGSRGGYLISMFPTGGEVIYLRASLRERPEHTKFNTFLSLSFSWSQSVCRTATFGLPFQVMVPEESCGV